MSPWIRARRRRQPNVAGAATDQSLAAALELTGVHQGETVFIVGSGPSLNALSPDARAALARAPSIGLNRVQYLVPTRYFLSAYPAEVMLAQRRLRDATILHMR